MQPQLSYIHTKTINEGRTHEMLGSGDHALSKTGATGTTSPAKSRSMILTSHSCSPRDCSIQYISSKRKELRGEREEHSGITDLLPLLIVSSSINRVDLIAGLIRLLLQGPLEHVQNPLQWRVISGSSAVNKVSL